MYLSFLFAIERVIIENGTNVSSATSLVINILEKKLSKTKIITSPLNVLVLLTKASPICRNTESF